MYKENFLSLSRDVAWKSACNIFSWYNVAVLTCQWQTNWWMLTWRTDTHKLTHRVAPPLWHGSAGWVKVLLSFQFQKVTFCCSALPENINFIYRNYCDLERHSTENETKLKLAEIFRICMSVDGFILAVCHPVTDSLYCHSHSYAHNSFIFYFITVKRL